jgi:hypothetical protein
LSSIHFVEELNMRFTVFGCLLLALVPSIASQTPSENLETGLQPRVLSAAGRIKFGIPMFGASGRISCDTAGDVVFNVGSIGGLGPFLRVQSDGRDHIVYELPGELKGPANIAWAITPDGEFFVLYEDFKEYKLIRFKDDGSLGGISLLEVPQGVDVSYLAVANNHTVFAQGYHESSDPRNKPRTGFAALFGPSGGLTRDLSSDAPLFDPKTSGTGPVDGDAIAGEDGNFYVLSEKRVLVLNQSGETIRDLKFQKPTEGAHADQVDYSKGTISIVFHRLHRPSPRQSAAVEVRTILLNSQTGEEEGSYVFDSSSTGSILCFDSHDGYTTMAVDGELAAKDIVPLR